MSDPLESAEFKLRSARILLREMGNDLAPRPLNSPMAAMMESTGAIVGTPWEQEKFWAHLDAFLVMVRSIPDVVVWWCGVDRMMNTKDTRSWYSTINSIERARRQNFQARFERHFAKFRKLPLSRARRFSVHVHGIPAANVRVIGRWGIFHKGGPTSNLPASEFKRIGARDDPALQWAATQPPIPLVPSPSDFRRVTTSGKRVGKPLLLECNEYLQQGEDLIRWARGILSRVYGSSTPTPPPLI
jgi:hypothetical protein